MHDLKKHILFVSSKLTTYIIFKTYNYKIEKKSKISMLWFANLSHHINCGPKYLLAKTRSMQIMSEMTKGKM